MSKIVKLQHDYIATLLQQVPLTATGEIAVSLSVEIDADMGFIVIDRDNNMKEERMFFHRKNANTVYVYSVNRDAPRQHDVGANVILDVLQSVNYAIDTGFPQMYIYKKSNSSVIVTGGNFFINNDMVKIPTKEFNSFVNGVENNIYIKNKEYFVTNVDHKDLYLVGKVYVDISGNVQDIDMARTLSIGDGMTQAEREKLASINPDEYEKISSKIAEIRDVNIATHTNYPTEKSVALELQKYVKKDGSKKLTDENFTKDEKDFLARLLGLGLENIDFSMLHPLRDNIRSIVQASHNESVSEKALAIEFSKYIKKDGNKQLSEFDFNEEYKNALDEFLRDKINYLKKTDVIQIVRKPNQALDDKVPTELAVSKRLEDFVERVPGKDLSDLNFTQEILDKINNLGKKYKTPVVAGTGIAVTDLGEKGWQVSSTTETDVAVTGANVDIFPLDKNAREVYIDEQRYLTLIDTTRTGFWGQCSFKNAKNPSVKVYYNNPHNGGNIMIDTHVRIIKSDGSVVEHHKTIPYAVPVKKGHGMFMLKPETFESLDYNGADVIYIKIFRVGNYYTDKYGIENNYVLDDLDTVKGSVRFKSMYISYEQQVTKEDDIAKKVIDKLYNEDDIGGYTGELFDSNCNKIGEIKNGFFREVEKKDTGSDKLKGLMVTYKINNATENKTLNDNITETELVNVFYSLLQDLYNVGLFTLNNNSFIVKELNKFSFNNVDNNSTYTLDGEESTPENVIEFLMNLVNYMKDSFAGLADNNKCSGIDVNLKQHITNYNFNITGKEIYELDIKTSSLNDYKLFVYSLIKDILNTNIFNGDINKVTRITNNYNVLNGRETYLIDNNVNNLQQFGFMLYTFIRDLKKIKLISN